MSWPGTAFGIIYTAHTLTVPVVCHFGHFGHFVKKNWTGKLFILRSSYVQQSMLTKLKLVVWRKTLIRRLPEKHLGSCFQDMSKVNFILRHLGKTFLTHSWISRKRSCTESRLKWSGKGRAVIGNRFSDGSCQRDIWSKCERSSTFTPLSVLWR